jgi:hypothetical protein
VQETLGDPIREPAARDERPLVEPHLEIAACEVTGDPFDVVTVARVV